MIRATARLLVCIVLPAMLAACGSGMGDLEQFVAATKAKKSVHIEPIPQVKQYEAFTYVPGTRRDPFVPQEPTRQSSGFSTSSSLHPDLHRNKEPLEEFSLDSLSMVGTINFNDKIYALVKAPDNIIHRVTLGDHMGQNYGAITKITETEITLAEIIPDGFGGWTQRPASIALAQQQ
ncbi:MAG: pilus assembly protein PilP [Stenotrophobium sp.]